MNRRGFIYRLAFITPMVAIQLNSCRVSESEWDLIRDFVHDIRKIILPSGDGIEVEYLHIEDFVVTMLKDCYSPADHERFLGGRRALDTYCSRSHDSSFAALNRENKKEIVDRLNNKGGDLDKDSFFLYSKVKSKIIQGFQQSELLMKNMKQYELVPGRYNGHFKIS